MKTQKLKNVSNEEVCKNAIKKYNYLSFLYNATHPKPFCTNPPHQVYIELTNACNLRCSQCPRYTMRRKPQMMDIKLFEKIIKELAPHQPFIDLYLQGESLLYPKIDEAVKICRKYGLLPRITTNTTLLDKKMSKKLIEAKLNKIEFSMSGATKKTYETIHRGATYEKTLENILDFLELNAEAGFPVHTRTVFVDQEKNHAEKKKYLKLYSKLPIDDIYVSPLINMFEWNKEIDLSPFKKLPKEKWPICKVAWRQFGVNADGTVRACIFDYDSRHLIGNANKSNIIDIWNNEKMMNFRKTIIEKRYEDFDKPGLPLCTACSQIWPTGDKKNDSTQFPQDFISETESFFAKEQPTLKAKYADIGIKKKKAQYLKEHRIDWLKEALKN